LSGEDIDEAMTLEGPPVFLRRAKYYNYFTNEEWRQVGSFYLREAEVEIVADKLRRVQAG